METKYHGYDDVQTKESPNKYSLNENRGDLIFLLLEIFGESCNSVYDSFTLDAPQYIYKGIDKSISKEGEIGKLITIIKKFIKDQSYLITPITNSNSNNNNNDNNNNNSNKSNNNNNNNNSGTNYGLNSKGREEEYISSIQSSPLSSSSSMYSTTPNPSSHVSSPLNQSENKTDAFQINENSENELDAANIKIKELQLELQRVMGEFSAMNNSATPPPPPKASAPPPPPPPPPPVTVVKQPSFLLKKVVNDNNNNNNNNNTNESNITNNTNNTNNNRQPATFNFADVLLNRPQLKKVGRDRSPGGTPAKEPKNKGGSVEDALLKAIVNKFKHANSPVKSQNDDSSDSDFE
ncbi:hypothetical protein ACTA71_012166 [Dictyostelium dimigraforme]